MTEYKKPITHNMTDSFDIPPNFTKGVTQTTITSCPSCGKEGEHDIHEFELTCSFCGHEWICIPRNKNDKLFFHCHPLDLAFTIQDPCGNTAITLAREVLKLISNRKDDGVCQSLIHDIQALNLKYRR
jgi:hypothetical protein